MTKKIYDELTEDQLSVLYKARFMQDYPDRSLLFRRIFKLDDALKEARTWHPMTEPPPSSEPAYLVAAWSGDEWYYTTAYWHKYHDLIDDEESVGRFMTGEYEWFQFEGQEPYPFDASRYSLWRAIHNEPPPPNPTEYVR
jgi:hypothetical protein